MELNRFFISFLFVTLPGIVAAKIFWYLTGNRARKDWHEFLDIFLFSLVSYSLYGLLIWVTKRGDQYHGLQLFNLLLDQNTNSAPVYFPEIAWVSVVALPVAFLTAYAHTYKLLNRLGQKIRATFKYGDEDVWEFFHNTGKVEWVFIRDHKLDLTYKCWINTYSDSGKERELIINNVSVYSNVTSDFLYDVDSMYLARNKDDLTIELIPKEKGAIENAR